MICAWCAASCRAWCAICSCLSVDPSRIADPEIAAESERERLKLLAAALFARRSDAIVRRALARRIRDSRGRAASLSPGDGAAAVDAPAKARAADRAAGRDRRSAIVHRRSAIGHRDRHVVGARASARVPLSIGRRMAATGDRRLTAVRWLSVILQRLSLIVPRLSWIVRRPVRRVLRPARRRAVADVKRSSTRSSGRNCSSTTPWWRRHRRSTSGPTA